MSVYLTILGLNPGGGAGRKTKVPLQFHFVPKYGSARSEVAICKLNGVNTNFEITPETYYSMSVAIGWEWFSY